MQRAPPRDPSAVVHTSHSELFTESRRRQQDVARRIDK